MMKEYKDSRQPGCSIEGLQHRLLPERKQITSRETFVCMMGDFSSQYIWNSLAYGRSMDWGSGFQMFVPEGLWPDEGVEELKLEKKVTSPLRTEKEIEEQSIDINLPPVERFLLLLKGHPLQQICAMNELHNRIKSNKDFTYKVLPTVNTILATAPLEVQKHAALSFASIIKAGTLQPHISAGQLLPTVLKLLNNASADMSQCWVETAQVAVEHLPKDVTRREVVPLAQSMGQLSNPVHSRVVACELCRSMVTKFEPYWMKKELWPLIHSLCQDVDMSVRVAMTQNLSLVASALGMELSECVFAEIRQLLDDEELSVKAASVEALVAIVPMVKEDCKKSISPLFMKVCQTAMAKKGKLLATVSRVFGQAVQHLQEIMSEEDRTWALKFYKELCSFEIETQYNCDSSVSVIVSLDDTDIECRRWAAYNAPALVMFSGAKNYLQQIHDCVVMLSKDASSLVRRPLACGIHEIIKYLKVSAPKSVLKVVQVYLLLLRDGHEEVLEGLIQNLDCVLETLPLVSGFSLQPHLNDLIGSLLSCAKALESSLHWRLHESFLLKMDAVSSVATSEQVFSKCVPVMYRHITGNVVLPVRLAASKTLLHFLKHSKRADHRKEICVRITSDCLSCSSYQGRLMFLNIMDLVLERFSRNFFKINFFKPILQLAQDKIVNVRMKFYQMLPSLKKSLKLPSDMLLVNELEVCVRSAISSEMEPEACNCLRESVAELDQVSVMREVYSRQTFFEDEIIDSQKEDEEKQLWGDQQVEEEGLATIVSKQAVNCSNSKKLIGAEDRMKSASLSKMHTEKGPKGTSSKLPHGKKQMYSPQITKKTSTPSAGFSTPPSSLKLAGESGRSGFPAQMARRACSLTPGSLPSAGSSHLSASLDSTGDPTTPNHSPTAVRTSSLSNLSRSKGSKIKGLPSGRTKKHFS